MKVQKFKYKTMGDLRKQGANFPDMAKAFGVTKERVRQIVNFVNQPMEVCPVCSMPFSSEVDRCAARARKYGACKQCDLVNTFNLKAKSFIDHDLVTLQVLEEARDNSYSWAEMTKEFLPKAAGRKYAQRYLPYLREKRAKILQIKEKVNTSHQKFLLYSDENLK